MTVAELIAKLKGLPATSEVCLEDHNGDTFEVGVVSREGDWIYLSAGGSIDTDDDDEEDIDIEDEDEDDDEDDE